MAFAALAFVLAGCHATAGLSSPADAKGGSSIEQLKAIPADLKTDLDSITKPIDDANEVSDKLGTMPARLKVSGDDLAAMLQGVMSGGPAEVGANINVAADAKAELEETLKKLKGIVDGLKATPDKIATLAPKIAGSMAKAAALAVKAAAEAQITIANPFAGADAKAKAQADMKSIEQVKTDIQKTISDAQAKVTGLPAAATSAITKLSASIASLGGGKSGPKATAVAVGASTGKKPKSGEAAAAAGAAGAGGGAGGSGGSGASTAGGASAPAAGGAAAHGVATAPSGAAGAAAGPSAVATAAPSGAASLPAGEVPSTGTASPATAGASTPSAGATGGSTAESTVNASPVKLQVDVGASAGAVDPGTGNGQRIVGLLIAGAGVIGAGVGGWIMAAAKAQYDDVSGCSGTVCNNQNAIDTRNAARANGDIASFLMLGGAGLVVGGGIIWLVAPRAPSSPGKTGALQMGLTPGGFAAEGSF
jgi:hypothetical protein